MNERVHVVAGLLPGWTVSTLAILLGALAAVSLFAYKAMCVIVHGIVWIFKTLFVDLLASLFDMWP